MGSRWLLRRTACLSLLAAATGCGGGGNGSQVLAPPAICEASTQVTDRHARWDADIRCLDTTLRQQHPELNGNGGERAYREALDLVVAEIASLDDGRLTTRLMATVALLRDGHSYVTDSRWMKLGLRLERFPEGLYVVAASPGYAPLLGKRVVSIGGVPIATLRQRIATLIPAENTQTVPAREAGLLEITAVLQGLGVSLDQGQVEFAASDAENNEVRLRVAPQTGTEILTNFPTVRPPSLTNTGLAYFSQLDSTGRKLYIQYNACKERSDLPMARFASDVSALLERDGIERVVIDLRFNSGGSSAVIQPLADALAAWTGSRDPRRYALLVGRYTYSSALMNSVDLRRSSSVRTIGEVPGGNLDASFGQVRTQRLPYSGLVLQHSTKRFVLDASQRLLTPDVPVEWDWHSYSAGRDPALEVALGTR